MITRANDSQGDSRCSGPPSRATLTPSADRRLVYTPADPYAIASPSPTRNARDTSSSSRTESAPGDEFHSRSAIEPEQRGFAPFELSFRKTTGRITGRLVCFYKPLRDFISAEPTGEFSEPEEESQESCQQSQELFLFESYSLYCRLNGYKLVMARSEPYRRESIFLRGTNFRGCELSSRYSCLKAMHVDHIPTRGGCGRENGRAKRSR